MSESPAELIRAEIARMTSAKALAYGYAAGSGEYEDTEQEMEQELRESYDQDADGLAAWQYSRHYEVKPVVKKLGGKYVCWLYWYGGGKHGEPTWITLSNGMPSAASRCMESTATPIRHRGPQAPRHTRNVMSMMRR